jgi:hypothetical protein
MVRIGLKEAIEALRAELSESIQASVDKSLRFEVEQINLEFQVEVEKSAEAAGGVSFWVVNIGGGGSLSSTKTHTVNMQMKPVGSDGTPVLTGTRSQVIPD